MPPLLSVICVALSDTSLVHQKILFFLIYAGCLEISIFKSWKLKCVFNLFVSRTLLTSFGFFFNASTALRNVVLFTLPLPF